MEFQTLSRDRDLQSKGDREMKRNQSSREKFWKAHIAEAEAFGGTAAQYCRFRNLSIQSFYCWRKKFSATVDEKIQTSNFVPVAVSRDDFDVFNDQPHETLTLPDPKWVADFVMHLMRGVS